ncbi:MAG: hypothetical protein ACK41T_00450 [Pseudobdellovibrio sp.]
MSVKENFIQHLTAQFSNLFVDKLTALISDNLISPYILKLPQSTLTDIQNEIRDIYKLRAWSEKHLADQFKSTGLPIVKNNSVCMSYDFHLTPEKNLKLIEINTNASFLALGLSLYDFWKVNPQNKFSFSKLIAMFQHEAELLGNKSMPISIMDESPTEQRLFSEFLIYQQLLNANILDIKDIQKIKNETLIYNRYTDFYLSEDKSAPVKKLYQEGCIHLTPSPWEYFLLADKQRLFDWTQQTEIPHPKSLLKIYDLSSTPIDIIQTEKKNLFFKPKSSYGGKQAYKGSGISSKMLNSAIEQGFIAQEYAEPSEVDVMINNEPVKFKYDLRCYAYKDELQLVIARLYQGQTTNLKTFGGGFAVVDFTG